MPQLPARAAAPTAEKQAPSFYRYKVGDAQVNVISDGVNNFALGDTFVLNAKKDEVNAALEKAFMPKDKMSIQFAPLVINTGGKLVVVDTGNGPGAFASSKGNVGQFASNMVAAGIDPKAVDMVVISHFHGDHINGLLTADNVLAFPNAEVLVPAVEWKYFMDDGEMGKQTTDRMKGVFANARRVFDAGLKKKVTPYEWGKDVAPDCRRSRRVGHTPGHTSFMLSSRLRQGVHPVRHHQPSGAVRHQSGLAPDVRPGSGRWRKPPAARSTTCWLPTRCGFRASTIPFPAHGYVEKDGTGYRLVAGAVEPDRSEPGSDLTVMRGRSRTGAAFRILA